MKSIWLTMLLVVFAVIACWFAHKQVKEYTALQQVIAVKSCREQGFIMIQGTKIFCVNSNTTTPDRK